MVTWLATAALVVLAVTSMFWRGCEDMRQRNARQEQWLLVPAEVK